MKLLIFISLCGFIFPVCEELTQIQCDSNADCEWFEDIDYGNCSWFDQDQDSCEETLGCYGSYQYPGWYSGWYCAGGQYIIDNSYCQDSSLPPLACENTNQSEYLIVCNGGEYQNEVSWILNPGDTMGGAPYSQYICLSDGDYQLTMTDSWGDGWNGNAWSLYKGDVDGDLVAQCTLDNGLYDDCLFTVGTPAPPESCEESNQTECENDDTCQWVNNTTIGSCSSLSSQECYSTPECDWECTQWGSWYTWICYGTYYCSGGNYFIDSSYCEDVDFMEGDLNQDLIVNILDIIIIVDIILNQESSSSADINGDGIINILDVIELVDIIINA